MSTIKSLANMTRKILNVVDKDASKVPSAAATENRREASLHLASAVPLVGTVLDPLKPMMRGATADLPAGDPKKFDDPSSRAVAGVFVSTFVDLSSNMGLPMVIGPVALLLPTAYHLSLAAVDQVHAMGWDFVDKHADKE